MTAAALIAVCTATASYASMPRGESRGVAVPAEASGAVTIERVVTVLPDGRQIVKFVARSGNAGALSGGGIVVPRSAAGGAHESLPVVAPAAPAKAPAKAAAAKGAEKAPAAAPAAGSEGFIPSKPVGQGASASWSGSVNGWESNGAVLASGWETEEYSGGEGAMARAPRAPSSMQAQVLANSPDVLLTWSDRSTTESGFTVARQKLVGSTWTNTLTWNTPSNTQSWTDNPGGGTYRYRVRSYNSSGASSYTNWSTITVPDAAPPAPAGIPNAPTGLQVSASGDGACGLSWTDASSNETGFEVVRQRQIGMVNGSPDFGEWTVLPASANTTQMKDNPGAGTYRYQVRAVNASGGSAYTAWQTVTLAGGGSPQPEPQPQPTPPAAPTGLQVAAGSGSLTAAVTWTDASSDETGFVLVREQQSGTSWINSTSVALAANTTSASDTVSSAGTYRYKVQSVNGAGASAFTAPGSIVLSAPAPTIPAAPSSLQTAAQSDGATIRVTWADNSSNETGFELIRQTRIGSGAEDFGEWIQFPQGSGVTAFNDQPGAGTYRYMVRANGASGDSAWTPWSVVTLGGGTPTNPVPPAAPSSLAAADMGNGRVIVSWTDNSNNETAFELERNPAFTGGSVVLGADQTAYINDVTDGTYSYRVRATNSAGASAYTGWIPVTISTGGGSTPPPPPPPPQGGSGGTGWFDMTIPSGGRAIYVSSTSGNNANDGLDPSRPVRTVAAGYALLRSGYPDQLLLKAGESWNEDLGVMIGNEFRKSGPSATAKMVVGSYGTGTARPRLVTANNGFDRGSMNGSSGNLAVVGIAFINGGGGDYGFCWQGGGTNANILVEDCYFERYRQNLSIQGATNVTVRRNVAVDASKSGMGLPAALGFYFALNNGVLIEENILDHNGWFGSNPPDIYHHNCYVQDDNTNVTFRRNISMNAGSHGVQMRSGGITEDNLFVRNSISLLLGGVGQGNYANGVTGTIRGNVVLEGKDISPTLLRGSGINMENISTQGVLCENNIVANRLTTNADAQGIEVRPTSNAGVRAATIRNNLVYAWGGVNVLNPTATLSNVTISGNYIQGGPNTNTPLMVLYGLNTSLVSMSGNKYSSGRSASSWFEVGGAARSFTQWQSSAEASAVNQAVTLPTPNASTGTYAGLIGLQPNHDAFAAAIRQQSRRNWRDDMSIDALLNYFRGAYSTTAGSQ